MGTSIAVLVWNTLRIAEIVNQFRTAYAGCGLDLVQHWRPSADTVFFNPGRYFVVIKWQQAERKAPGFRVGDAEAVRPGGYATIMCSAMVRGSGIGAPSSRIPAKCIRMAIRVNSAVFVQAPWIRQSAMLSA